MTPSSTSCARGSAASTTPPACASLRVLGGVPGDDVTALIAGFASARDAGVASTALRELAARGDRSALPALEKLLRSRDTGRRLEALQCVHALRRDDPGWPDELLDRLSRRSRTRSAAERSLVITLLAELEARAALRAVWQELDHDDWTVRAAAIDFCRVVRDTDSVPRLIDRLDDEDGRLREDLLDTLHSLTAMRFGASSRWDRWWREHAADFELIPADAFAEQSPRPAARRGTTSSYYGIPLVSDRVVFVVDVSGSMSAKIGTDDSRSRLDEAKRQLRRVVEDCPEDFRFNVVSFHTRVEPVFDAMQRAGRRQRQAALRGIAELKAQGATNVHDALRRAFDESELDTIYLLSDGAPSAGPITDAEALADEVLRWNRTRHLRIHCISIGTDSSLLRRLADESGGEYALFR